MKKTCNDCYAWNCDKAREPYCELGHPIEITEKTKTEHLHYVWYGKPLVECEKPKTIKDWCIVRAKYLRIKL